MKRILFLLAILILFCILALSVGAVSGVSSNEFGEITYVSGVNENTEIKDKTSRVVLLNKDGTYTTYPAYYISDVVLQWQGTVQYNFNALNNALGTQYDMKSIVRIEILTDSTIMNNNGGSYQGTKNLKEVVFPEGTQITDLCQQLFKASGIEKIKIPATVTTLGTHVFEDCASLKEVTFEDGISITSIPAQMFTLCVSLEKIALPDSVESVGASCFAGCTSLREIRFGKNFKSIGKYALALCKGDMVMYAHSMFLENETSIPTGLLSYDSGDLHNVTLFLTATVDKAQALKDKASHRGLKNAVLNEWDPTKPESYYIPENPTNWTIVYCYNMCSHKWSDNESAKVTDFFSPISVGKACIKCQTISETRTISPIFEYAGYSVTETADVNGKYHMTVGYIINNDSIKRYKEYGTFEYGFVISFSSTPLTVQGGKVTAKDGTASYVSSPSGKFDFCDIKIGGLTKSLNGKTISMCIYAYDGTNVYYLGEQGQSTQTVGIKINLK